MLNSDQVFGWLAEQGLDPEYVEDDTEILICCPTCQDTKPRLYISADGGMWFCFHCGSQGTLVEIVRSLVGDFDEAFELTRRWKTEDVDAFDLVPAPRPKAKPFRAVDLPAEYRPINTRAPAHYTKYLEKRGISIELAQSRDIGYCLTGPYRYRIIVPVVNDGQLYTYVARTILVRCPTCGGDISPKVRAGGCSCERPISKVLTPPGGRPSLAVFNLDAVRANPSSRLLVMEGWGDALRRPGEAVAILGSSPSPTQVSLLAGVARGRAVVVCLDGDNAGRAGAVKVADGLASAMIPCRVAHVPDGTDPGKLTKEKLEEVLTAAKPYVL